MSMHNLHTEYSQKTRKTCTKSKTIKGIENVGHVQSGVAKSKGIYTCVTVPIEKGPSALKEKL